VQWQALRSLPAAPRHVSPQEGLDVCPDAAAAGPHAAPCRGQHGAQGRLAQHVFAQGNTRRLLRFPGTLNCRKNTMRKALLTTLGLLLAAPLAHAADVSLGLNSKTLAGDFTSQPIGQGLAVTAGLLHHADNGSVGSVGLQVSQQVADGVEGRLGGKFYFVQNDTRNASALALGGQLDFAVPAVPRLSVGLHLWYAPQITSFNGADNFDDIGVSVAYRAMSNAEVFAAYRRVQVDYDREGGRTLHSGPLLGLRLFF
jgi:YfaZ precursor